MNSLVLYIARNKIDDVDAMNRLQDHGIVADECVDPRDVAPSECAAAIAFLKGEHPVFPGMN